MIFIRNYVLLPVQKVLIMQCCRKLSLSSIENMACQESYSILSILFLIHFVLYNGTHLIKFMDYKTLSIPLTRKKLPSVNRKLFCMIIVGCSSSMKCYSESHI